MYLISAIAGGSLVAAVTTNEGFSLLIVVCVIAGVIYSLMKEK